MSDHRSRRRFLAAAGAAGVTVLAGCSSGSDGSNESNGSSGSSGGTNATGTTNAASGGGQGGELDLLVTAVDSLDPIDGTSFANGFYQLFETLMTFPNGETTPKYGLATGHELSDDATTYTVELEKGVTFHNGKSLTAHDVVYSWRRLAGSKHTANANNIIGDTFSVKHETDSDGNYVPDSLAVKALDDHTLRFELEAPFDSTLSILADYSLGVVPEGIVGDIKGYSGEMPYQRFVKNPVGSGPFAFDHWRQGDEIVLTAFEDYHGDVAKLDRLHWNIVPGPTARYNAAMNRNVDVFDQLTIPTAKFEPGKVSIDQRKPDGRRIGSYGPVQNGATLNYGVVSNLTTQYLTFNTTAVPHPVRQAVAYVMNQQQIVRTVYKGLGRPAYFMTPPTVFPGGRQAYTERAKQGYPYGYNESRIGKAKSVMEDAGYGSGNTASFTFTALADSSWSDVAQQLQDQLRAAHIDMQVESAPYSTILNRALDGNLEVFSFADSLEWPAADNLLRYLHPEAATFTFWGQNGKSESANRAKRAWQNYLDNRGPGKQAQQARNEAYLAIERANWQGLAQLPMRHGVAQRFWYDDTNVGMYGPMLVQRYNHVTVE